MNLQTKHLSEILNMLSINYSEKTLKLQDIIIKRVDSNKGNLLISVELKR